MGIKFTNTAVAISALFAIVPTTQALAQTVEITEKNGGASVQGVLIETREDKYTLQTNIGVVTFLREDVICTGASCPVSLSGSKDISIAAPAELADIIVPLMADGFAESEELETRLIDRNGVPISEVSSQDTNLRNLQADATYEYNIQLLDEESEAAANIFVQSSTNSGAFDLLASGEASLILSEVTAPAQAISALRQSGGGDLSSLDQERVLAVDGYVIVTHPLNKIEALSLPQIQAIFSGEIQNWSDVGGADTPINVYSFAPDAEAFHHINDLILKPNAKTLLEEATTVNSNRELTVAIEEDPYSVGIVSYSSVRDTKPIAIENECGMTIEPSAFNIKTEEYTLQNRITAYTRQDQSELVTGFMDYIDGPTLDNLVAKSGLISLGIIPETDADTRARLNAAVSNSTAEVSSQLLRQFVLDVMEYGRLSTIFRFASSSSGLDNKAQRDLSRVLQYIDDKKPTKIILAGFADSDGGFSENLTLSKIRAEAVLRRLKDSDISGVLDGIEIDVRGYGELSPVACNETASGRGTNRRVEIWM